MDTFANETYKRVSELMKEMSELLELFSETKSGEQCPFCLRTLEQYLRDVPQHKYISVDVPLDVFEFNKIESMVTFINIFNRAAWTHNQGDSVIKVKYLNRQMGWTDSTDDLNISKEEWFKGG